MRISTLQIYNIADVGIADAQTAINKTQEQLSTGKRILTPADDPVGATTVLQISQEIARIEQYEKNIDIAENTLRLEEETLSSVTNLIFRLEELATQAGNTATLSKDEYQTLAAEADARLDELLELTNTQNASGQYIFAGYQGGAAPFEDTGGSGFLYKGDEGQLSIKLSKSTSVGVTDSGKRLFVDVPSAQNTITTSTNPNNVTYPGVTITLGQVVDQTAYDDFYPKDMVVTFNDINAVSPADLNFTVTERDTGKVIVANQQYRPGDPVVVNGVEFSVNGVPASGTAATPATIAFGSDAVQNFAGNETGETLTIRVGGVTETLTIGSNITNNADLVAELSSATNAPLLANLGVTVNNSVIPPQLEVPKGINFTVDPFNSSGTNIKAALGINSGSTSINGVLAQPGDQYYINSSDTQGLLTTVQRFTDALRNLGDTPENKQILSQIVADTLGNLNNSLTTIQGVTSEIGARLNTLESVRSLQSDSKLLNQEVLSDIQDLDYAEASTRLSLSQLVLSAAQQSFVRVSGLTLFQFL